MLAPRVVIAIFLLHAAVIFQFLAPASPALGQTANPPIVLSPSQGPAGSQVTATQDGPAPGTICLPVVVQGQVLFDGTQVLANYTQPTSCPGFSVTFTIPANATLGTHTITFTTQGTATFTVTTQPPPPATIQISEVRVNQGVDAVTQAGATIATLISINGDTTPDIVANRETVIRVRVTVPSNTSLPPNTPVSVSVDFQGQIIPAARTMTVAELLAQPQSYFDVFLTPTVAGSARIVATATAGGASARSNDLNVDLHAVKPVSLAFMGISTPQAGIVTNQELRSIADPAFRLFRGMFPIGLATEEVIDTPYSEDPVRTPVIFSGGSILNVQALVEETARIYAVAKLRRPAANRVVTITDNQWFSAYGFPLDVAGFNMSPASLPSLSLCRKNQVSPPQPNLICAVHELGHSFQCCAPEPYNNLEGYGAGFIGRPTRGYWVQERREIPRSIDFMGGAPGPGSVNEVYESLDNCPLPGQTANPSCKSRWATSEVFAFLFRQLVAQRDDPDVLVVSGTLGQGGTGNITNLVRQTGAVDISRPGNGAIQLVDSGGRLLSQLTFPIDFTTELFRSEISQPAVLTADSVPFGLAVPFVPGAVEVRLVRNGQAVARSGIPSIPNTLTGPLPLPTPITTRTPTATPIPARVVVLPALLPPPPPPVLPPPPPAQLMPPLPVGRGVSPQLPPAGDRPATPLMAEVPIIPEAESLVLLVGGLGAVGAVLTARSMRRRGVLGVPRWLRQR